MSAVLRAMPRQTVSSLFAPEMRTSVTESVESYRMMARLGLIRKSSNGMYSMLPLGLRALNKLEGVIDQEMARVGGQKLSLPLVLPKELWQRTGRWEQTGAELFRLQDRHGGDFCLAPTHEEEITSLVASAVSSYRSLPLRLYQTGRKYRDEVRPRFGLIRAREFVMKDMYTFDADERGAGETYEDVCRAYKTIFERLELDVVMAQADTGNIGGRRSHEFHLVSKIGEDEILRCTSCDYAANSERATSVKTTGIAPGSQSASIRSLLSDFGVQMELTGPASVSKVQLEDGSVAAVVHLRSHKVNLYHVKNALAMGSLATHTNEPIKPTRLLIDVAAAGHSPTDAGSAASSVVIDHFVAAEAGDGCPCCGANGKGKLASSRGIEVGHAFYLGTKYSSMLQAQFRASTGETRVMQMGCYGLGVSRLLAGIVEAHGKSSSFNWPRLVAPIHVCIVVTETLGKPGYEALHDVANALYDQLSAVSPLGDVIIDDREDLTVGKRLSDASLMGYPFVVIVGREFSKTGKFEVQQRVSGAKSQVHMLDAADVARFVGWRG